MSNNDENKKETFYEFVRSCAHSVTLQYFGSVGFGSGLVAGFGSGIMASPRSFSDMSAMEQRRPCSTAPRWRVYKGGLNLEGYCQNSSCDAYNQSRVIIPLGYRIFRFNIDSYLSKCPLCGSRVLEETCGFSDAEYKYNGFQQVEDNAKEVNSGWSDAPNGCYTTFKADGHLVKWFQLTLEARRR